MQSEVNHLVFQTSLHCPHFQGQLVKKIWGSISAVKKSGDYKLWLRGQKVEFWTRSILAESKIRRIYLFGWIEK